MERGDLSGSASDGVVWERAEIGTVWSCGSVLGWAC